MSSFLSRTLPPFLSPSVCPTRAEALFIGDIYTELLGEFGRFVGGSVNAVNTLKKGLFVSPLALKVGHLEKSLKDLITFLEVGLLHSASGRPRCVVLSSPGLLQP